MAEATKRMHRITVEEAARAKELADAESRAYQAWEEAERLKANYRRALAEKYSAQFLAEHTFADIDVEGRLLTVNDPF